MTGDDSSSLATERDTGNTNDAYTITVVIESLRRIGLNIYRSRFTNAIIIIIERKRVMESSIAIESK